MAKKSVLKLVSAQAQTSDPSGPGGSPASRTLIEHAYVLLREDIVEGRLAPGTRLRVEHLKDRYQVSAGTLREALSRLVSDELVVAEGQRGFTVAPVTIEELIDLTNLRVNVEIEALRQSIRNGGEAWRRQLVQAYDELSPHESPLAPANARFWEAANARFHEALLAACGSPWTLRVLRHLNQHSERYRRYAIVLQDNDRDVHAEHQLIFDSALAGQEARAALALEMHIRATPDLLIRTMQGGQDVFIANPLNRTPPFPA